MKSVIKYLFLFVVWAAVLLNTSGLYIEHHMCEHCTDGTCSVGEAPVEPSCCGDACTHQSSPVDSQAHHHHQCNLSDIEHHKSNPDCACFVEYFQVPVFFSKIIEHQIEFDAINFLFETKNWMITPIYTAQTHSIWHVPPDNVPAIEQKHILFCNYRC